MTKANKRRKRPKPDLKEIFTLLMGIWRRRLHIAGPPDRLQTREFRAVVEAVTELQAIFDGEKLSDSLYLENPELLAAYMLYFWPLHYQQALSLLGEIPGPFHRVLDLCAGGAPFAFGALRWGASDLLAVDKSPTALRWGAELAGRYGMTMNVEPWCYPAPLPGGEPYDLIILAHGLEDLSRQGLKGESIVQFCLSLVERLTPEGHLLLVEGTLPMSNKRLLLLRDALVEKSLEIASPCLWQGKCPALQSEAPCYAQRPMEKPYLMKEIQRAASIRLSSLKMSYLIVRSPYHSRKEVDSLEKEGVYRVISPPIEALSTDSRCYYLCGWEGRRRLLIPKNLPHAPKRGELIRLKGCKRRGQDLELEEGSTCETVAQGVIL